MKRQTCSAKKGGGFRLHINSQRLVLSAPLGNKWKLFCNGMPANSICQGKCGGDPVDCVCVCFGKGQEPAEITIKDVFVCSSDWFPSSSSGVSGDSFLA